MISDRETDVIEWIVVARLIVFGTDWATFVLNRKEKEDFLIS